jgi:hypothetical protein
MTWAGLKKCRGVGGERGVGPADAVERAEHVLLDRHALEHGLYDEIGGRRRREIAVARDPADGGGGVRGAEAPLRGRGLEGRCQALESRLERGRLRLDQQHLVPRRREADRDSGAHRARADDRDAPDGPRRRRRACGCPRPLGEEQVPEALRGDRRPALLEQAPRQRQRRVEGLGHGGLDAFYDEAGCGQART